MSSQWYACRDWMQRFRSTGGVLTRASFLPRARYLLLPPLSFPPPPRVQGILKPNGGDMGMNTFAGHAFAWRKPGSKDFLLGECVVDESMEECAYPTSTSSRPAPAPTRGAKAARASDYVAEAKTCAGGINFENAHGCVGEAKSSARHDKMASEALAALAAPSSHDVPGTHHASGVTNVDIAAILAANGASVIVDDGTAHPERYVTRLEDLGVPFATYLRDAPDLTNQFRPMGAKFRSFWPRKLQMRYDDGSKHGAYSGLIRSMGYTATNTYTKHVFAFHEMPAGGNDPNAPPGALVKRFTMDDNGQMYILEPENNAAGEEVKASPTYKATMAEYKFAGEYFAEHGTPWLSFYPRAKPVLNLWPATQLGQSHHVFSSHGYYSCDPRGISETEAEACGSAQGVRVPLKLEVVSTSPKVFVVEDLLSEFECEHIRALGETVVHRSTVGDGGSAYVARLFFSSSFLVSLCCFLLHFFLAIVDLPHLTAPPARPRRPKRSQLHVQDAHERARLAQAGRNARDRRYLRTLCRRHGHRRRQAASRSECRALAGSAVRRWAGVRVACCFAVERSAAGCAPPRPAPPLRCSRAHHSHGTLSRHPLSLSPSRYTPHHDFGYTGKAEQRFLTLLLYIEVPEEGGATSFPKAHGGRGMKVKPPRGTGVLFYSMKRDGNADDFSLHSGMPVRKGHKWICNLWVWDPKVKF